MSYEIMKKEASSQLAVRCECGSNKIIFDNLTLNNETVNKKYKKHLPSVIACMAFVVIFTFLLCVVQSKFSIELNAERESQDAKDGIVTFTEKISPNFNKNQTNSFLPKNIASVFEAETNIGKVFEESDNNFSFDKKTTNIDTQNEDEKIKEKVLERSDTGPEIRFDKSIFVRLHNQSKIKSSEEIVNRSVNPNPEQDNLVRQDNQENQDEKRKGRANVFRGIDLLQGRTSEDILNEIVNFGLEQSQHLFDVQEKRIYDKGLSLKKSDPGHFVGVYNKQSQRAKDLSKYAYATLHASSLLSKQ